MRQAKRSYFDYRRPALASKRKGDRLAAKFARVAFGSRPTGNPIMFDLTAVQAAIREAGFDGWLLYDFRGLNVLAQRVAGLNAESSRAAGSTSSPRPASRGSSSHAIEPASLDHLPGTKTDLPPLAGTRGRRRRARERREAGRDGVQPAQRQPVHRPRRCRHHRAGAVVRRRGRPVRRSDPAVRGDLGRRAGEVALRGREAVPRRLRRGLRVHRGRDQGEGHGDGNRGAGADHGPLRRARHDDLQPADRRRRPAQRRPALRHQPRDRHADRARRLRADRPVGEARPAARGLQRLDARRLRRRDGAGEVREDLQHRRRGPRRRHRDGEGRLRREASRSRAGRSTTRPAR